jgi:hypothetical protein
MYILENGALSANGADCKESSLWAGWILFALALVVDHGSDFMLHAYYYMIAWGSFCGVNCR